LAFVYLFKPFDTKTASGVATPPAFISDLQEKNATTFALNLIAVAAYRSSDIDAFGIESVFKARSFPPDLISANAIAASPCCVTRRQST